MRTLVAVSAALGLAVAACNQSQQHNVQAETKTDTQATAQDVKESAQKVGEDVKSQVKDVGVDVKKIASDPEVKKAQGELKSALKDLGVSVKHATKKAKEGSEGAGESGDKAKS